MNGETQKTLHLLHELLGNYDTDLRWIDRSNRRKLTDYTAQASDTPKEVAEFALLGNRRCPIRTGSARTTLLMLAAGEPIVQVDDDTVSRIIPLPGFESGILLSSKSDANQYWFDPGKDTALSRETGTDFLSLHESLLGQHPAAVIDDTPNINHIEGGLLEKLGRPEAWIAVTFADALGDSGRYRHWQWLCFEGDSFRRLVGDGQAYPTKLFTRQLFRGFPQTAIADGPFCMAMNIGLDARRLLPPFMPVQRNQDGIFGQLLYLCFKRFAPLMSFSQYCGLSLNGPLGRTHRKNCLLWEAICLI